MLSVAGLNAVTSPEGNPWLAVAKQLGVTLDVVDAQGKEDKQIADVRRGKHRHAKFGGSRAQARAQVGGVALGLDDERSGVEAMPANLESVLGGEHFDIFQFET